MAVSERSLFTEVSIDVKKTANVTLRVVTLIFLFSCVLLSTSLAQDVEIMKRGVVKVQVTTLGAKTKVGSGFVVKLESNAVYIVTASHVVEEYRKVEVEFYPHKYNLFDANVIRMEADDPEGLALLKVNEKPEGLAALALKSSTPVTGGDPITTIGFKRILGVPWAVIQGNIVGHKGKTIVFSGSVEEGNSGGPLIMGNQVIGIVTEVTDKDAFAAPALIAKYTLKNWGIELLEAQVGLQKAMTGRIFVETVPTDAVVRILNIREPFEQGIELEPRDYHLEVSLAGYKTQEKWIKLGAGEEKRLYFELVKIEPKLGRLYVDAVPEDPKIRILNIRPRFYQGMELDPGSYHIEVSAEDHTKMEARIKIH